MSQLVKARKIGGSLMVTLPKDLVKEKMIIPNETIEIEVRKPRRSYFGALKGIGKFTEEDRFRGHE